MNQTQPTPPFPPNDDLNAPGLECKLDPAPRYKAPKYKGAEKLAGKVALITGGDSGIGRSVATLYAREGADVAILCTPYEEEDAREIQRVIEEEEGQRALIMMGDVKDFDFCKAAVRRVVEKFGKLDILVNNAAFQNHVEDLDELSMEQWDKTFKTNIYGYFYMVKAALPHLKEGSCIVNTGSITGLEGSAGLLDYSATKGAIHAFTKTLAQMLVERGIRVNCVAPGPVWTPLNPAERSASETRTFGQDTPMHRPAQPEEIAPAYVYFASDVDSPYVTGEILTQLGGSTRAA